MRKYRDFPTISVLMPVYNAEKFLANTLHSLFEQEFKNWELIAIDDFSTDESAEILTRFSKKDTRIKFHKNNEKGIIPALKKAYSLSSGAFITRMDADDLMPKNKLRTMLLKLEESGRKHIVVGKVSYFAYQRMGEGYITYQNWLNNLIISDAHWENIYKECVIPSACWIAYREDLDNIQAFHQSNYPEDYDLAFRFYMAKYKVISVPEIMHYWRDHEFRASRKDANYKDQNFYLLKLKYFLEIDHDPTSSLFLWGAGKKGKQFARLLNAHNIPFIWITDNAKKMGKEIYGNKILHTYILQEHQQKQVIITIADRQFRAEKAKLFSNYELLPESIFEL